MKPASLAGVGALCIALLLPATAANGSAGIGTPTLMVLPKPASIAPGTGRIAITPSFTVHLAGPDDRRLRAGVSRALRRWEERMAVTFPRTAAGEFVLTDAPDRSQLVVRCRDACARIPALGDDESYTLEVDGRQAVLDAATTTGVLRGIETLLQMLSPDESGWFIPAAKIQDSPRFAWRGLLVDPCRHWMPVDVIERILDGMAVVKLNVLHLHLTDDQAIRIESRRFPKLHQLGSDGRFYSQQQMRELVAYAADRGIRVMPEFDVPGHSTSWLVAFPELASGPGPFQLPQVYRIFDPVFDPTNEATYELLDGFLGEMADVFPDAYVHIGGDENNGRQWSANERIQRFVAERGLKGNAGLHAYFNQRLSALLEKRGRRLVGWDEILHGDLPLASVVQSWRGPKGLAQATSAGHPVLLSNGYYLDYGMYAAQYYANDPLPAGNTLTAEQRARVLGGEACMWAEWVTAENVESRLWPRAAAVAERLWSPADVRDVDDLYTRLACVGLRLEEAGSRHQANSRSMLARIMGRDPSDAVMRVLGLVEAYGFHGRLRVQRGVTIHTPMTRVVDSIPVESIPARAFDAEIGRFVLGTRCGDGRMAARIAEAFGEWTRLAAEIAASCAGSAATRDVVYAADVLREGARIGGEALERLRGRTPAEPEWTRTALAALDKLDSDNPACLGFPFLRSVRRLVVAASLGVPPLATSDESWRRAVAKAETPPRVQRR